MWGQPPPAVRASASSPFFGRESNLPKFQSLQQRSFAPQDSRGRLSPHVFRSCRRLYHVSVHGLAGRLLWHIRRQEMLKAGGRGGGCVFGGIGFVGLFRLLLEFGGERGICLS